MPKILIVDDEKHLRESLQFRFFQKRYTDVDMAATAQEAESMIKQNSYTLVIIDLNLPDKNGLTILDFLKNHDPLCESIILTAMDEIDVAVSCIKKGAYDYILKPFNFEKLFFSVIRAIEKRELENEVQSLREKILFNKLKHPEAFSNMITVSDNMLRLFQVIESISHSNNPVLILGESGTGKELVASIIHQLSPRKNNTFIAFNVGGFSKELFKDRLFGHVKGAFTGAIKDAKGLFEEAKGGTLFLDEIGELDLYLQVNLLRVLEENEYFRLGDSKPTRADARIIVASNRDLHLEVEKGNFRRDLYFRLHINDIKLPALRERREDIPCLIEHFFKRFTAIHNKPLKGINGDVKNLLLHYDYPGNIRELENIINGSILRERSNFLSIPALPEELIPESRGEEMQFNNLQALWEIEKRHIKKVLKQTNNNQTQAAKILRISRQSLIRRLKEYQAGR